MSSKKERRENVDGEDKRENTMLERAKQWRYETHS
jgi:hypothetical protein